MSHFKAFKTLERIKPVNRHILIVPHVEKKDLRTASGVVLPEDYEPENESHIEATVIDVADDCSKQFNSLRYGAIAEDRRIIVQSSMIQEISLNFRVHHMILENYVVGMYKAADDS